MAQFRGFEVQLENFRREAENIARYVYADMAVQHAASKSKKLLSRLNDTPLFWLTCSSAFQLAAYISLGRVFDRSSKFTVEKLLDSFEKNMLLFSRAKLAERKREGRTADPSWLVGYLDDAHYPSNKDVKNLNEKVEKYREIYDRAIRTPRNKYLAHREKIDEAEIARIFGRGTKKELWRLSIFLIQLHENLWQLLHNGRKPIFRSVRYSPKSIFDSSGEGGMVHERIVAEVRELMQRLET